MAGMPSSLIQRAEEILHELEGKQTNERGGSLASTDSPGLQLSIFDAHSEVFTGIRSMISDVDINNLTPVEALVILSEIKKKIK